ncbi:Leucine-rich repeat (LRR) family protein [Zea mays]|uniref:Leucine-rich repeat (LRR) family protein n=1 Tax=Zea mays TaxID=4577 RepID=A0A1D6Q2Z0_MAIZE|nr:Leucine-rich repeat (LRR) family protein [Zea mays]
MASNLISASSLETETAMADPGEGPTAPPPPRLQEIAHDVPDHTVTQFSASQDTETAAGDAATHDSAQPKAESAHCAVGEPEQTTTEADGQPHVATMPQEVAALPSPAETPVQESAAQPTLPPQKQESPVPELASSVHEEEKDASKARGDEGEEKPTAARRPQLKETVNLGAVEQTTTQEVAALPSPAETPAQESAAKATPPPEKQEGGAPELASSVHEEEKDASKASGDEGLEKPASRRWRWLRAVVGLLFLRPKSGETKMPTPPSDKQPVSGLEDTKPTTGEMPPPHKDSGSPVLVPSKPEVGKTEGEMKTAAVDVKKPVSGQEEQKPAAKKKPSRKYSSGAPRREMEDGERSKGGRVEIETQVGKATPQLEGERPMRKKLQKAIRLVQLLMSLYNKHRSQSQEKKPDTASDPGGEEDSEARLESAPEDKKPASAEQEEQKPAAKKKPSRKYSDGAARKLKDDGEMGKGRRDEIQVGKAIPQLEGERPMRKKLQKAIKLVQLLMSLYNKHRSQSQDRKPGTASGPGGEEDSEAKRASAPEEKKPQHRNWPREEVRLEHILEETFTRLLLTEYNKQLSGVSQKCLLTFSIFELASEVKKQIMIYWWVAEFNLRHRSDPARALSGGGETSDSPALQGKGADAADSRDDAESIFIMLSDHGFLVPMKNWCSKVIHGCQVNPLVHWMLKRMARGCRFAELDDKGSPEDLQPNSNILCLTAGNRHVLQQMHMADESQTQAKARKKDESQTQTKKKDHSQAWGKSKVTNEPSMQGKGNDVQDQQQPEAHVGSTSTAAADKTPSQKDEDPTQVTEQLTNKGPQDVKPSSEPEHGDEIPPPSFEGKRVILNLNAHVYPICKSAFSNLAECLVVLQLGRWNNLDDKTYMEVDGLESRDAIGSLKNLRYLSLRGLSRLTELPKGIESLKKLEILDMRGCQNLARVSAGVIKQLKQLTHLDLTECYMLEHIGRGITSLTELQVFKGFVFATGTRGKEACRIQDLRRLKKLQKLTICITTDANVGKREMADLKYLASLRKLTITWSEIPSILEGGTKKAREKRRGLVKTWTSFQLPPDLMKLDIRCYPKEELELECNEKLERLYLRGGDMRRCSTKEPSSIKTLRLRYLRHFEMGWSDIRSKFEKLEYVEIVVNDKNPMEIPDFTLDWDGVWTKDEKEEHNNHQRLQAAPNKKDVGMDKDVQDDGSGNHKEPTKAASTITKVNKDKAATKERAGPLFP